MRILFISRELGGADLCLRLLREGHDVKLYIAERDQRQNLDGIVEKVTDWRKELSWVGKNGLIVFDSTGYGRIQDKLRREGYSVVGGCYLADRMEDDRAFGEECMARCGIHTIPSQSFHSIDEAINFVQKNPKQWVIKQNSHASKIFNYVGQLKDGSDVLEVLRSYGKNNKKDASHIQLQERVFGVEIGVGRYFNGHDWVGPIEMNVEHKSLYNSGLGPKTDEMGTLMWFDAREKENVFFQRVLAGFRDYLREINFRGEFEINCIVNENGIFPLEITARFGFPATQLQSAFFLSPWGEFLKAVADGKTYRLRYRKGFGVIVLIATPPFPYEAISNRYSVQGARIFFRNITKKQIHENVHIEELSKDEAGHMIITGKGGFILDVSGVGATIDIARKRAYRLAKDIIIPKKFYRTDIGEKFKDREAEMLKKWGYLPKDFRY